ncbi:MAG: hypothetical protein IJC91_03010, partial [Oscillospiraceae bacterium]|nr:hypothetical protein [Oscillospiraceae bacterium]
MSILKKTSTAAVICVVVCIISLLLGVHFSVNRQINKLEESFTHGVYSKEAGYTLPSIQEQLDDRYNAAIGIISLIPSEQASDLRSACDHLLEAGSISEKAFFNKTLQYAFEDMLAKSDTFDFDERTQKGFEEYCSAMENAQRLIEKSGYNEAAAEFENEILGSFPLNILKYP